MIADGERLKSFLEKARIKVVLCAPFIKEKVLQTILEVVSESVQVQIVTRWRAREVAAGISDLEIFHIAKKRPNTKLALLDDLHAKLYLADEQCLVGSANLTGSALGWSKRSNIELLIHAKPTDIYVAFLLEQLKTAVPATIEILSEIEAASTVLKSTVLDEGQDMTGDIGFRKLAWLPRCAAPDKLWEIYNDPLTTVVVENTKKDGCSDLRDLQIHHGLSKIKFEVAVQNSLLLMPAFNQIIDEVPKGIKDSRGKALIARFRPNFEEQNLQKQWYIVRAWIGYFFVDKFEVAPESFITRLKSKQ